MAFFVLLLLGGAILIWVLGVEPNWYRIRRKRVPVKKAIGEPLTILHLSDFHFTKHRFFLGRFFDRLSRLDVDFVFVTGDLIDGPGGIEPCIANLKKLKPRRGIYAVLGNHDYRIYPFFDVGSWGLDRFVRSRPRPETGELKNRLVESGIRLLVNENLAVPLEGGCKAIVIGVDDPVTGRADLAAAFRGIEDGTLHPAPQEAPPVKAERNGEHFPKGHNLEATAVKPWCGVHLALVHSPRLFPLLSRRGIDLAFAGHTHGGQIRIPGIGALPLVRRRVRVVDSTNRYGFFGLVSRGLGATPTVRLRLFCRPEALLVRIEGS